MYPVYRFVQPPKKSIFWRWVFPIIFAIAILGYIYIFDWAGIIDLPYVDDNGSKATDPNN